MNKKKNPTLLIRLYINHHEAPIHLNCKLSTSIQCFPLFSVKMYVTATPTVSNFIATVVITRAMLLKKTNQFTETITLKHSENKDGAYLIYIYHISQKNNQAVKTTTNTSLKILLCALSGD